MYVRTWVYLLNYQRGKLRLMNEGGSGWRTIRVLLRIVRAGSESARRKLQGELDKLGRVTRPIPFDYLAESFEKKKKISYNS